MSLILAMSTSSPLASLAVLEDDGVCRWSGEQEAPRAASRALAELLDQMRRETNLGFDQFTLFAADLGPGSFTGVRVAVTMAKTLAYVQGALTAGRNAFDLIAPNQTVVLPSKRGEWFVRVAGEDPVRTPDLPVSAYVGFGPGIPNEVYPHAKRMLEGDPLAAIPAAELVPEYLIEPSISTPKTAYRPEVAP